MQENFRQFLDRLREEGELIDLKQPVDIRHIATLVDQSDKALLFHNVIGYSLPVVSGIIRSQTRATISMGCKTYGEIEQKLKHAIDHPIPPVMVNTSHSREVVHTGDDIDLFKLPIPMSSVYDGGPMITAGVVIRQDPPLGRKSRNYPVTVKENALAGTDNHATNNNRPFAAISHRRAAIYYALHMPWENTWLAAPTRYAAIRQALRTAGVTVKDINVTLGGCAFWHAVISIKKQPGEAKNAILAALSVMDLKHVVVVDDDIDVFNPTDVEWAIATRVQADRDVLIVTNARGKPLDPSLPPTRPGVVPTTAKIGIDATIGEGIPKERYERIVYAYADSAKIGDYAKGKVDAAGRAGDAATVTGLADEILTLIDQKPLYYTEVAERFSRFDFQTVARALGHPHQTERLWHAPEGRMCRRGSKFAAKPPGSS